MCEILEPVHEFGKKNLRYIVTFVELQETLFMFGGRWNRFQSVFPFCSGYDSEVLDSSPDLNMGNLVM